MSIYEILEKLENEGKLVRYLPLVGTSARRRLYFTDRFGRELADQRSAINFFGQKCSIVGLFDRWLSGREVIVRLKGRVGKSELARLEPPPEEIWEFRVTEPRPQLRIFFRFAAPDVAIVFLARNRDALGSASKNSGKASKAWMEAMYECEAEWKRIFGRTPFFQGTRASDYISENARECS